MTTPRVNGKLYSYASVTMRVGSLLVDRFKSITYSDNLAPVAGYGASRAHGPVAFTQGKYEADNVQATVEKSQLQALRKALADEAGGTSFGTVEFEIVVSYEENGEIITDTIQRVRWTKNAAKADDGGDPLYDDVEWKPMFIKWNGLTLFEESKS